MAIALMAVRCGACATAQTPLVEAQGMMINANADMVLTAQAASATPHQSGLPDKLCSPSN